MNTCSKALFVFDSDESRLPPPWATLRHPPSTASGPGAPAPSAPRATPSPAAFRCPSSSNSPARQPKFQPISLDVHSISLDFLLKSGVKPVAARLSPLDLRLVYARLLLETDVKAREELEDAQGPGHGRGVGQRMGREGAQEGFRLLLAT